MVILLLLLAAIFGYLALDAYSLGKPVRGVPYEIEAKARGESLDGVSLIEQRKRQAWHRSYGVGRPADVVWIWAILSGACFALAVMVAYE